MGPSRLGLYRRYQLLVDLMLGRRGWTFDQLLADPPSQGLVEKRLVEVEAP